MKVCYKSFDGREFNTEDECRRYEVKIQNSLRMYTYNGRTDNPGLALAVEINSKEDAESFKGLCEENDCSSIGITAEKGIFIWFEDERQFFKLDSSMLQALEVCFKDREARD